MTTSRQEEFLSEVRNAEALPIPEEKLAFFRARLKNRLHSFIIGKWEVQKESGLRAVLQTDIADRLGKRPEQINRWLGAPGNWTIETISDLLLAISGEELPLDGEPTFDEPITLYNHIGPSWAEGIRVAGDAKVEVCIKQTETRNIAVENQSITRSSAIFPALPPPTLKMKMLVGSPNDYVKVVI